MLTIEFSARFKKDYKALKKRGFDISQLEKVIAILQEQSPLPPKNRDHALTGNWAGFRECHISPDWLLIYQIDNEVLVLTLTRTGSHSDLF